MARKAVGAGSPQGRAAESSKPSRNGDLRALSRVGVERSDRVAEQVYRNLRRAIIMGEISAGSRLREVEIALNQGVSRTPVREAISRLIGDRLVRELPAGGVEVTDTSAELHEIYCIREALETCAGRLAAKRITEQQLAKLDKLVKAGKTLDRGDVKERARVNEQFHATIIEASGSPRLAEMVNGFREFFLNTRWLDRDDIASAERALQDHLEIVEALRARAPRRVERLIQRHLKDAYAKLLANASHAQDVEVVEADIEI